MIDEIGIVEILNKRLGIEPREKVSTGVIVKAMLLNGLGFVTAPLYLFGQFFQGKATEQLLGKGIKPEHLNDDRLGNVLDEIHEAGLSELFLEISLAAAAKFEVKRETAHLDSTSFHVDGAYASSEPGAIEITYGYSRDHRPDLKQFMMNLICVGDGDIPVVMEIASGNQSDKARFAQLFQDFSKQWTFDGLCVADGALYSADNITAMRGLKWLTRVPLTISAATALVDEVVELADSDIKGYRIKESSSEYAGVEQRWFLVESEQRRKSDLQQLTKKIERHRQKSQQQLHQLVQIEFACLADATTAAQNLSEQMTWHQLTELEIVAKNHYDKPGNPKPDAIPSRISFRVTATVVAINNSVIAAQRVRCGRFILASNVLDSAVLSASDALREYKAQQGVERGFRFLKDPLFFTSSVFLKSPKRVAALGMIMALCLLVYNLGQRQLRQALAGQDQTIPNQLGTPTSSPTLRWVFQCFMAVHLVVFQGVQQVVNLSDDRLHILRFFSPACRRYYLLCDPAS